MAYLYDGICQTQSGSVIYKRKKHVFNGDDLKRIIKKLGLPDDDLAAYKMMLAAMEMMDVLSKVDQSDIQGFAAELNSALFVYAGTADRFEGFGGGTFGGAGATGTWWKPFDV